MRRLECSPAHAARYGEEAGLRFAASPQGGVRAVLLAAGSLGRNQSKSGQGQGMNEYLIG